MGQTILVLEDERPLLQAIQKKLELNGFEVLTARSVDQAEEYLKNVEGIRAIWLDHYLLGKTTGLDFVARLKSVEGTKHLPIFVVSNTASPDKIQSYIRLGVTRYYTKSNYRLDQIIQDIRQAFEKPNE